MHAIEKPVPPVRLIFEPTIEKSCISEIGAKAFRLSELIGCNMPVPKFFCITTSGFDAWIEQSATYRKLCDSKIEVSQDSAIAIAQDLTGNCIPDGVELAILDHFDKHFSRSDKVSVRSSATDEDSADDSFAGLLSSVLFVPRERLTESVLQCYLSAISPRVIAYRQARGKRFNKLSCAVIVQKMVNAHKSGVAFSANPLTNNRDEIVITGGYGIGEGVVADKVSSDTFFLKKSGFEVVKADISLKRQKLVFNQKNNIGTLLGNVNKDESKQEILNKEQLNRLAELICKTENYFDYPQDIEWSLTKDDCFYLLQSRPISTLIQGERRIFDNSNIKENYPGTITPFTFSYTRWLYSIAIRKVNKEFGATRKQLSENAELFDNFVCLIKGHIYYNMSNWYKIYAMLPGFEKYIPVFERTFSLKSDAELNKAFKPSMYNAKRGFHKIYVIFRIVHNYIFFKKKSKAFHDNFSDVRKFYRKQQLDTASVDKLVDLIDVVTHRTLLNSGVTLVNDFFTFIFFHLLQKLISGIDLEESDATLNRLLLHESNMESVANVESVAALTAHVQLNEELKALVTSEESAIDVLKKVRLGKKYEQFNKLLNLHVEEYGDRSTEELKLESPTIRNQPYLLIEYIRSYLKSNFSYIDISARNRAQRMVAEASVRKQLRSMFQKIYFSWCLHGARRGVREREDFRFARTRLFGMVRSLTFEIGQRFVRYGLLNEVSDIYYLSLDEVKYFVRTGHCPLDFRSVVEQRKQIYSKEYDSLQLPERITTHGPVGLFDIESVVPVNADNNHTLTGLGCASGVIQAPALVVPDPNKVANAEGKILVARMTDPGWIFLMLGAKGLVVEHGNILSHTAIIGRELGIPTIVGVEDAMSQINDGKVIEIDGSRGTVRLIS